MLALPRRNETGAPARTCTSTLRLCTATCTALTPRELGKRLHHAGAAPAHAVWKAAMRAATSMMLELVAEFGIAPNSPRLQRGANLSQLFSRKGIPPRGIAPRSVGYRSTVLLLSYRGSADGSSLKSEFALSVTAVRRTTASGLSPDRTGLRIRALEMLCICGADETGKGGAPENRTLDAVVAQLFSKQFPRLCRTCSVKWLPGLDSHQHALQHLINSQARLLFRHLGNLPGRIRTRDHVIRSHKLCS